MATIKDVAKLAQVSVTTVSKIINHQVNVSDEKYRRVLDAIDALGFNPNYLASNLRNNKLRFIGIIVPYISGIYSEIISGIESVLSKNGFIFVTRVTQNSQFVEKQAVEDLINLGIRGLLIVSSSIAGKEMGHDYKVPVIYMERTPPEEIDCSSVVFDSMAAMHVLFEQLLQDAGNTGVSVCLVCGEAFSSEAACEEGFWVAVRTYGVEKLNILHTSLDPELSIPDLNIKLNALDALPDVFVATDSNLAASLQYIFQLLHIGRPVYYLGGNGLQSITKSRDFTIIHRDAFTLGKTSADLLIEFISSPELFENKKKVIPMDPILHEYNPVSQSKPSLRLLMLKDQPSDSLLKLLDNYRKTFGINVEVQKHSSTDLYNAITACGEAGSDDFDIFMVDIPWLDGLTEKGYFYNLSEFITSDEDDYQNRFIKPIREEFFRDPSSVYAIPFMATLQYLFYRKDLFENNDLKREFYKSCGFELAPPSTWTSFVKTARFFTRSLNQMSPTEYGTSILGNNSTGIMDEFLPRQWAFKGRISNNRNEIVFNSIENRRTLQNMVDCYECVPPDSLKWWWDTQIDSFLSGNMSMLMTFATHLPKYGIHDYAVDYSNVGIAKVPGNHPLLGGWLLAVSSGSRFPSEAYRFIKWATGSEIAVASTLFGGLQPQNTVVNNTRLIQCFPWLSGFETSLSAARKREIIFSAHKGRLDPLLFEEIIAEGIFSLLRQECSIDSVLSSIQQKSENAVIR